MFRIWADATMLSLVLAGLLGVVVACTTGPSLAMGMAILGGNTEPVMPELAFPWVIWVVCVTGALLGRVSAERAVHPNFRRGWRVAALVSAVACVIVPLVQLARLTSLAAAG